MPIVVRIRKLLLNLGVDIVQGDMDSACRHRSTASAIERDHQGLNQIRRVIGYSLVCCEPYAPIPYRNQLLFVPGKDVR